MTKIRVMSENLANKIAAGEVVEKCASIVKELVENSIDAHAQSIKVSLKEGGIKEIMVTDDGIGMDKDVLEQVTDLFFTTKKNGTGLGTSLSKEIVELHGGKIKYLSEVGIGTTVIINLPII